MTRNGILLYTGGSGSEGSLGGLVGLADRIDELLAAALERAALCSNDPFCASHEPNSELEKRYAHGAACHGCLLIAETSCDAARISGSSTGRADFDPTRSSLLHR